jgi:hypothetical protein
MTHLGKTISLAFNDMLDKADCLKSNRDFFSEKYKYIEKSSNNYIYLMSFIEFE